MLSLTVSAQDFETVYERALLDSAYRYELLKPVTFNLRIAYEYQTREIVAVRMQVDNMRMSASVREKEIANAERKRRWRLTAFSFGAGILIGVLTH